MSKILFVISGFVLGWSGTSMANSSCVYGSDFDSHVAIDYASDSRISGCKKNGGPCYREKMDDLDIVVYPCAKIEVEFAVNDDVLKTILLDKLPYLENTEPATVNLRSYLRQNQMIEEDDRLWVVKVKITAPENQYEGFGFKAYSNGEPVKTSSDGFW